MTSIICDICGNGYSSLNSLIHHKKTARFCLILQNKKTDKLVCKDCKKEFTTKHNYVSHVSGCKEMLLNKVKQYEEQNKQYEDQIKQYKDQIKQYEDQIKHLRKELKEYKDECISYRNHLLAKNKKHVHNTTVINNTINNTTYDSQYNQFVEDVPPVTLDYVPYKE